MPSNNKSAFITGGASGMGLAVAQALSSRQNETWDLHLIDLNAEAGNKAASSLKNAYFHQTNITNYSALAGAFQKAFEISGRLDFVFANAGIVERDNFYEKHDLSSIPPEPNQLSIDILFKAVVTTSYLALHFFRKNPDHVKKSGSGPALVMTASCGGLYPSEFCPMYSGAKAAVVQFNRAIAYPFHLDGIRTYATCPGTVETGLMSGEEWKSFPKQYFTPIKTVVDSVVKLVDGGSLVDANGRKEPADKAWGLTVEINGDSMYFRDQVPYCDGNMEAMMKFTSMENQLARIEKGRADSVTAKET